MPELFPLFVNVENPTIIKISLRKLNMVKIFKSSSSSSLHHLHNHFLLLYYHFHPHHFHHHHHLLLQHHLLYHLYRISNLPIIYNFFYSSKQLHEINWSCIICEFNHVKWANTKDKKRAGNKNSNLMAYLIYYKIIFCMCYFIQCTLLCALLYINKHLYCVIVYLKQRVLYFMGDIRVLQ